METDTWLKALALAHPQDLLRLIGDPGGTAVSAQVLELRSSERRVDCVIEVRHENATHYRHIEFQAAADPDMARRCFRYNSQLLLQLEAPVLTTVLYLFPPGPADEELAFRVVLQGREVNIWRFQVMRLWEIDGAAALESGAPGLLALVPLMKGATLASIARADREIARSSSGDAAEQAQSTLIHLAGYHYTVEDLESLFGRRKMIQSSVWQAALAEGQAEGKAEGLVEGLRMACRVQMRRHHPSLLVRAEPFIEACNDPERLQVWVVEASELDHEAFARLIGLA